MNTTLHTTLPATSHELYINSYINSYMKCERAGAVIGLEMQTSSASALLQNLPRHPSAPLMLSAVKQTAPERTAATLYIATHDRTEPPADQVVTTERMNALMRQFHQREESRARERQKRAISSSPADDDREPARKASRKNAATATDEGSDGEALPRSGAL